MSFVQRGSLILNVTVSVYFASYQIVQCLRTTNESQPSQSSLSSNFTCILTSILFIVSPILHILALKNPSCCYKGHCNPPHHYDQIKQKMFFQNPKTSNQFPQKITQSKKLKQFNIDKSDKVKTSDNKTQQMKGNQFQNIELREIKFDKNFSNPARNGQNFNSNSGLKRRIFYNEENNRYQRQCEKQKGEQSPEFRWKINKVQHQHQHQLPSKKLKLFSNKKLDEYEDQVNHSPLQHYHQQNQQQKEQQTNVNQFSSLNVFLTNSRKSLSNLADNNISPRSSRKSIKVVKSSRNQDNNDNNGNISLQPFIQKQNKFNESNQKNNYYDYLRTQRKSRKSSHKHRNSLQDTITKYRSPQPLPTTPVKQQQQIISPEQNQNQTSYIQCQFCQQCMIPRYLRMKHCFRCKKCVHKYDHHCVLLDICIGEFNQKYYIGFLYAHLYNTVFLMKYLLIDIKENVYMDPVTGIEHINGMYTLEAFSIIILTLNLILTTYLVNIHTRFLVNGSTTYEKERRSTINYFRFLEKVWALNLSLEQRRKRSKLPEAYEQLKSYLPFDYGFFKNISLLIKAKGNNPIDWKLQLFQPDEQVDLGKKSQNKQKIASSAKDKQTLGSDWYEWGAESRSSGNVQQTGQATTKSRESQTFKSNQQEINFAKYIFKN